MKEHKKVYRKMGSEDMYIIVWIHMCLWKDVTWVNGLMPKSKCYLFILGINFCYTFGWYSKFKGADRKRIEPSQGSKCQWQIYAGLFNKTHPLQESITEEVNFLKEISNQEKVRIYLQLWNYLTFLRKIHPNPFFPGSTRWNCPESAK